MSELLSELLFRPVGVSVIVCTRDRPGLLAGALVALQGAVRPGDEVLVVDSSPSTGETAAVAARLGVRVIRVDRPGLSRARNAGLAATSRPVVAFTDDDCLPAPGWTALIEGAFSPGVGVVTGPGVGVVTGPGVGVVTGPGVGVVTGPVRGERPGGESTTVDPGDRPFTVRGSIEPASLGAGANLAFRRAALEAVGGFDEELGAGTPLRSGEDHDAVWRVVRDGWSARYEPSALVVHRDWRDPWALVRMQWGYGLGAGALASKVVRVDSRAGWALLGRRLGHYGLGSAGRNLARRWRRATISNLLYTAGVGVGFARTWRWPLDRGHLVRRPAGDVPPPGG